MVLWKAEGHRNVSFTHSLILYPFFPRHIETAPSPTHMRMHALMNVPSSHPPPFHFPSRLSPSEYSTYIMLFGQIPLTYVLQEMTDFDL